MELMRVSVLFRREVSAPFNMRRRIKRLNVQANLK